MIAHGFFLGAFFIPEKVVCVLIFPGQLPLFGVGALKVTSFWRSVLRRAEGDALLAIGREVCSFCLRAGFDCWILQLADRPGGVPASLFVRVSIIGFCDLPAWFEPICARRRIG